MDIPNSFKKAIKNVFYDKEMKLYSVNEITDSEGAIVSADSEIEIEGGKFNGNFQFTTREKIQDEYGLSVDANALITCESTIAEIGQLLEYNHEKYEIKAKLIRDSHILLLVKGNQ